ncbi:hypothetical protein [Pseudonocardia sp. ICBG601]|nr:hypothetical protein [Pseudonocardia sp. ICBG601]
MTVHLRRDDGDGAELEVVDVAGVPPAPGDGEGSGLTGMPSGRHSSAPRG